MKNCTRKMYNYLYPVMTYYDMALNLLAVGDIFFVSTFLPIVRFISGFFREFTVGQTISGNRFMRCNVCDIKYTLVLSTRLFSAIQYREKRRCNGVKILHVWKSPFWTLV